MPRSNQRFTTGTNRNSPLSGRPMQHWAYVIATGFDKRARETEIKLELEYQIQRKTGKTYYVRIEKEPNQHSNYNTFRIACYCTKSEIFMDRTIWPANVNFAWHSKRIGSKVGKSTTLSSRYRKHLLSLRWVRAAIK